MAGAAVQLIIDGDPVEVRYGMKAMVAVERKFGGKAWEDRPMECGAYAAWFTLGMPGGDGGFDTWLDSVEFAFDSDPVDPQVAATSSELSPPSQ